MMIAHLIRPVWEWVLWSRRRLAVTVCILALLVIVTGRVARAHHSQHAPQASRPATAHPSSSGPAGALVAGQQFAAAWVTRAPGWQTQARRYATPALAAQLGKPARAHLRAAAITGPAAAASQAAGSVTVTVPTTAGVAVITVVRSAGRWLAGTAQLAVDVAGLPGYAGAFLGYGGRRLGLRPSSKNWRRHPRPAMSGRPSNDGSTSLSSTGSATWLTWCLP